MMAEIHYRKAVIKDCEEIACLKGEVWNTTYRGIYLDETLDNYDVKRNESTFIKIVNNPNLLLYVATDSGKIVGFMSCGEPYRQFREYKQEIGLLYILKEYQRMGLGKQLFEIGRDFIRSNGVAEFIVSVNKYNANALAFYIAMGGKVVYMDKDNVERQDAEVKLHYSV